MLTVVFMLLKNEAQYFWIDSKRFERQMNEENFNKPIVSNPKVDDVN